MAPTNFWNKVQEKIRNAKVEVKNAVDTYRAWGNYLMRGKISGNQLIRNADRLVGIIRREQIGRMVMFFYDPKLANELPYYDRFPLVIPLELYDNGFLGINLHYLPPLQRAKLLDAILNIYDDDYLNERKKLMMSYNMLRSYTRSRLFVPCIKRYLYSHARSKYYMVDPQDWHVAVLLPTERFEKASKTRVFAESMLKVRR